MTNYFLKENDIITQSASFKFDANCFETEEDIVRNDLGQLMLQSDYDVYITTPEYLAEQFQNAIQYQHDAFNEYSREIIYQIQYNTALGNTTLVTNLQSQLQTEQQAVIARINDITTAYNGGST